MPCAISGICIRPEVLPKRHTWWKISLFVSSRSGDNPMNEGIPRPLLVLTVIIVLAAIFLGIKDHFQKPPYRPPGADPVSAKPNITAPIKQTNSTKARISRLAKNSSTIAYPTTNDIEQQRISGTYSDADAKALMVSHASNPVGSVQTGRIQANAATDARSRLGDEINTKIVKARLSEPQCIPLPNSVVHGDVDAPYYENWAKEYSCHLR